MEACKRTDRGRCSRRPRRVAISAWIAAVILTGLSFASESQRPEQTDTAPPNGAELLRRFLDETRTLQATFRQELLGPDREVIERASGNLSIRRPGRFHWRYLEPVDQLIVADGENLWIYDAELEQATVTPLDQAAPASPAMLLSGEATLDTEFDVVESFEADGLEWVRLTPKPAGTDFEEVLIGFDAGMLRRLRLLDSLDQVTTLDFEDVRINTTLADSLFEFVPPRGVDVIGEAR